MQHIDVCNQFFGIQIWLYVCLCLYALLVCVCHCTVLCVCVCVMSAITQRGSDTPLCLIPSSNPPVSRHCCRGRQNIGSHTSVTRVSQTHTSEDACVCARTKTHTQTGGVYTKYLTGQLPITQSHTQLYLQPLSENTGTSLMNEVSPVAKVSAWILLLNNFSPASHCIYIFLDQK